MSLLLLAWYFFILSLVAFGAATSVVPDLHRILVESHHVMSAEHFAGLFSMSQAAPGTNVMFVTVLGWQIASLPGALIATLAFVGPTGMIALAVEHYGSRHRDKRWHMNIRRSLAPITVGLLFSTGYLLGRETVTPVGIALMAMTATLLIKSRITPLWLTALGGVLGAVGLV